VITLPGVANKMSRIKWDLEGNLKALINASFLPDRSVVHARVIYDLTWRFRLFINGVGSITGQPDYYVAFNSGVKKEDFAKFTNFESEVLQNKFLSWRNPVRTITREQPEWLYFLQVIDRYDYYWAGLFDELVLNVTIYYDDNSTETIKPFKNDTCQKYGVLEWPVSYSALELGNKEGVKTITHYECWIVHNKDEDNQDPTIYEDVSEKVTYVLDEEDYLDTHYVFRNSFGVFETVRAIGLKENEFTTIKSEISKILEAGYSTEDGESEYYSSIFRDRYSVAINAPNKKDFDWFKDLLLSSDAYIVVGAHLVKIMIEPGKFPMDKDDDTTFILPFTYKFANTNSKYSNIT
jgi:hypothetical protein